MSATQTPETGTAPPVPAPLPKAAEQGAAHGSDPTDGLLPGRPLPARRPGRWAATAVTLVVVAQLVHGLVTNRAFQWTVVGDWFVDPVVLDGLRITLEVTALSAVLGGALGVLLALARLSGVPLLQGASWVYVWIFRSVPMLVLLLLVFNFNALYSRLQVGVPFGPGFAHVDTLTLLGSPLVIAVVGFTLNEAAYAAELVRGGILSVDQGQLEAASALGLPKHRQYTRIVLPQALRAIVPTYVNQIIGLVKGTSLVYYVSLLDLFGQVQTQNSRVPQDIIPLYLVATIWYVVLTSALGVVQYYVERRYARGHVRSLPPTPLQRLRARVASLRPQQVAA
ncbi:amino acid ABC transporter membrane protein (PAAT family) [Motilibacter rhizosphaerae]|uniref:Amino acid ABC transporter membrane protein (PAAT family) n=1 Tax=Motilibacter rhizosphaerae TaxID=598652 RepID=A0A4Q7NU32_9ACTN|nr:amino acid ABC transporter permease [Motilibacter rhizosphaerae]RZS89922.1 amino acid ABC transporter membrane protein (PAAT family) [Motilibacter rhizosphaerae]